MLTDSQFNELEDAAVEIARRKMDTAPCSDRILRPRMGTGGEFEDLFLWDTAFICMWAMHFPEMPVENSLDNFYRLQAENGFIYRQYHPTGNPKFLDPHPICFAPPVLSWAEWELFRNGRGRERLGQVYPALKRHHASCREQFRMEDGLYTGCPLGCGMDNLPRWPSGWTDDGRGIKLSLEHVSAESDVNVPWMQHFLTADGYAWKVQWRYIDMAFEMARDARLLAAMAEELGRPDEQSAFEREHEELGALINERMWNEALGAYVDLGHGEQIERLHIGGFWPLIAGIVPKERVPRLAALLRDTRHFYRPTAIPSLAASEPDYTEGGKYWLGGVWAPTNYMVLKGLAHVGEGELARDLAERYLDTVWEVFGKTGTLWENYDPEQPSRGGQAMPDFCGWTGLAAVSIPREFIRPADCGA